MKKLIAVLLLATSTLASAHDGRGFRGGYYGGYHHGSGIGWVAPAVIGGVIGYELARPETVVVEQQQPSVIVQQPQTVVQAPPVGYHWQEMVDPQTGVRKIVAVPN